MSLRFRINLIITLLIVAFSLVTAKIVLDDARRQIREEMEAGTKVTLQLLTTVLYSSQFVPPTENEPNGVLLGLSARNSVACAQTRSACTLATGRCSTPRRHRCTRRAASAPQLVHASGGAAHAAGRACRQRRPHRDHTGSFALDSGRVG